MFSDWLERAQYVYALGDRFSYEVAPVMMGTFMTCLVCLNFILELSIT